MTLYEAAEAYAARGWCIIPLRANKKPALKSWKMYQKQRPSEEQLRGWFVVGRGVLGEVVGMGVVCGKVSGGLVVRDFDTMAGYEQFAAARPDLARTLPTVETSRGRHVYFLNRVRRIVKMGDGELRGAGYVCLPPTPHPTGKVYQWAVPLPDGQLMTISDVGNAMLVDDGGTLAVVATNKQCQRRQAESIGDALKGVVAALGLEVMLQRVQREQSVTERTEAIASVHSVLSVTQNPQPQEVPNAIDQAIRGTLPTAPGQRHRQVFKLARALKAIPGVAALPLPQLRPFVKAWHIRALPLINTKGFDETWCDFVNAWPNVKYPLGESAMDTIVERLKTSTPPPETAEYETPGLKLLVALCAELQRQSQTDPFYLDARTTARLLDVETMTAWRWLKMLKADALLVELETGRPGRATRWRWLGRNTG